jgi:protein phosphatase
MSDPSLQPALQTLSVSVGAASEIGQREQNQDCMTGFSSPFGAVYLVADGMGGHRGGAEASRIVAEAFSRHLLAVPPSSPVRDAVTLAARLTNIEILEKGKSGNPEFEGMGSTMVLALVRQNGSALELTTAHVGDSRIYLRRDHKLTQLTKDHTHVQWLIDTQALDEASARNHPDASVLTRAMGHTTDLQVDISQPIPLQAGDEILLCSDGLSGFTGAEEIDQTIEKSSDPTQCANDLVQLALASGSNDNITVQFLRIGPAAAARRPRATQRDSAAVLPKPAAPWRLMAAAVALVLVAGLAWWHFHPRPDLGKDPGLIKLEERIKKFQADTSRLHDDANAMNNAVHQDTQELSKLAGEAGKTDSLRTELRDLKDKLSQLEKSVDEILARSGDLEQNSRDHSTASDTLERPATDVQKSPDRKTQIEKLGAAVKKSETQLQEQQAKLDLAKKNRAQLEARKAKLEKDWNTPAHPPAKHPPDKPHPAQPGKGSDGDKPSGSKDDSGGKTSKDAQSGKTDEAK